MLAARWAGTRHARPAVSTDVSATTTNVMLGRAQCAGEVAVSTRKNRKIVERSLPRPPLNEVVLLRKVFVTRRGKQRWRDSA
jgi:hypothetical protein